MPIPALINLGSFSGPANGTSKQGNCRGPSTFYAFGTFPNSAAAKLQTSHDETNWYDVSGVTLSAAGLDIVGEKVLEYVRAVVSNGAAVAATGVLTLTQNAAEDNTVTIGNRTYRFKATPAQIDDVDIGGTASDSIDNLIAAITNGAGEGTAYFTGTTAHTQVTAADGAGNTMDVTAITAGAAGNSIATSDTLAGSSAFGATELEGGADAAAIDCYLER